MAHKSYELCGFVFVFLFFGASWQMSLCACLKIRIKILKKSQYKKTAYTGLEWHETDINFHLYVGYCFNNHLMNKKIEHAASTQCVPITKCFIETDWVSKLALKIEECQMAFCARYIAHVILQFTLRSNGNSKMLNDDRILSVPLFY